MKSVFSSQKNSEVEENKQAASGENKQSEKEKLEQPPDQTQEEYRMERGTFSGQQAQFQFQGDEMTFKDEGL